MAAALRPAGVAASFHPTPSGTPSLPAASGQPCAPHPQAHTGAPRGWAGPGRTGCPLPTDQLLGGRGVWCLYRVVEPQDCTALARPPGPLSAWSLKNDPVLPSGCSVFFCSLHSGHTAFTVPTPSPGHPSPRLCASVSCCADPSGPQAKSPLCHWTGRLRHRGASVWHFLVSQDKQERTGSGAGLSAPQPLPCASFPGRC